MNGDTPMFCRRCYANLKQAVGTLCPRCGRSFDANEPATYLRRSFPSRLKMTTHLLITVVLTSLISMIVAAVLAVAQMKYVHSGH